MLGLGETDEEVIEVMQRMREHDIDMLTLGQYLQPSRNHLPVQRFVHPDTFARFAEEGMKMGFKNVASPAGALLVPRRPAGSRRQARLIGPGGPVVPRKPRRRRIASAAFCCPRGGIRSVCQRSVGKKIAALRRIRLWSIVALVYTMRPTEGHCR